MRAIAATIVTVLLAVTAYEVAAAVGWLSYGFASGQGPRGSGVALVVALLAMLVGFVLTLVAASLEWSGVSALIAPAAAAFVLARFYTYDEYYLPTLRRVSDGGLFSPVWIYALVGVALAAAALARVRPGAGNALAAVALLLTGITAVAETAGH